MLPFHLDLLEDDPGSRDQAEFPAPRGPGQTWNRWSGWEHEVELLGPGGEVPGCVAGEGACPPEDVGGPHGYAHFREALADPRDPEHEQMRTWAGHWTDDFELATADLLVLQTAGAVPGPVKLVLALTAGGVKLTPGRRLPRAFVRQVQQSQPNWSFFERPSAIEEDLLPLVALHDLLRKVGLLRLRNGVLSPTRAADDEVEVIRRLRAWFGPDDGFVSVLVGESLASLVTEGPCRPEQLAARVFPLLGERWVTGEGEPLTLPRVVTELHRLQAVLTGLDLAETERGTWSAGPSACWLLPRATALAHLWSKWTTT